MVESESLFMSKDIYKLLCRMCTAFYVDEMYTVQRTDSQYYCIRSFQELMLMNWWVTGHTTRLVNCCSFDLLQVEELYCMQLALQKGSQVGGVFATGRLQIIEVSLHCRRSWNTAATPPKKSCCLLYVTPRPSHPTAPPTIHSMNYPTNEPSDDTAD
jgi:hypothetical protein